MSKNSTILPKMATIVQELYSAPLSDEQIIAIIQNEFARIGLPQKIKPGQSIAISSGSRGIASIALITRTIVEEVKKVGGEPFIFPAMGSHGNATDQGQIDMLESLGISESSMGCPIKSSMEVVVLGKTAKGLPVYLDKNASETDGIIIVNRIKAHTNFRGEVESGLMKMLAIGAGKQKQASAIHSLGAPGLRDNIPEVASIVLQEAPVLAGFAILEDAYHKATKVVGIEPQKFLKEESELLKEVRRTSPQLPLKELDVLVVDRMGKNISGAGIDTNVIGRLRLPEVPDFPEPVIKVVVVLDLTDESHGNAVGVGLADLTVKRLVDKMDFKATNTNALTSNGPLHAALPITLDTDREAIEAAVKYLLPPMDISDIKMIRIKDTLTLDRIEVSEAVLRELEIREGFIIEKGLTDFEFDETGALF